MYWAHKLDDAKTNNPRILNNMYISIHVNGQRMVNIMFLCWFWVSMNKTLSSYLYIR